MSRRLASAGLMRRAVRSPVSAGGSSGYAEDIFGVLLVENWDSSEGVTIVSDNVDVWTGRNLGYEAAAAAAGSRPTFTAANAALNDQPSINTMTLATGGANRGLRSAADHAILAANGARPYVYWVGTINTYGASERFAFALNATGGAAFKAVLQIIDADTVAYKINNTGTTAATFDTTDTAAHLWEGVIEADNQIVLYQDGAEVGRDATGAVLNNDAMRVSFGMSSVGSWLDASHAAAGICASAPSAPQRAALLAYSQTTWGTP